ncbi:MAG: hypothetical protein HQK54_06235, partial [Oligoflexales bacterium]|nr:hypothetical protein [Oligoflexales bacterium]
GTSDNSGRTAINSETAGSDRTDGMTDSNKEDRESSPVPSNGEGTPPSTVVTTSDGKNGASEAGTGTDSSSTHTALKCAKGYTCFAQSGTDVVWVMKNDGNVNGPACQSVCESALSENCSYYSGNKGQPCGSANIAGFAKIAAGLGFKCRQGGCWSSVSPGEGLVLVSIATDAGGSKACYFPKETNLSCSIDPGNANCYGERYSSVCPCVAKALDQACIWDCPPHNTTRAFWKTKGTSCLERINYWRKKACEEGWAECPPAGLPPMVECTACHECTNSEADWDSRNGSHSSFMRCGELVQGEGGGATCAAAIDGLVSERAPDKNGVMRCTGHCGPIVAPGCQTFSWGKARDSNFYTFNWGSCNASQCKSYCDNNPGTCFTLPGSTQMTCDNSGTGIEPGPKRPTCP